MRPIDDETRAAIQAAIDRRPSYAAAVGRWLRDLREIHRGRDSYPEPPHRGDKSVGLCASCDALRLLSRERPRKKPGQRTRSGRKTTSNPRGYGVRVPDEEILNAIRAWAAEHGHGPRASDWHAAGSPCSDHTVRKRFGSFVAACGLAGVPPHPRGARERLVSDAGAR